MTQHWVDARNGYCVPRFADFANQPDKQTQWAAFLKRLESAHRNARPSGLPDELPRLIARLAEFLTPVTQALADNQPLNHNWNPPGPWRP